MATSCLTAVGWALALPGPVQAAEAPKWTGHVEVVARPDSHQPSAGVELFLPLSQSADSLVFVDARLSASDDSELFGNFGVALRRIIRSDYIIGASIFLDHTRSEHKRSYHGVTLGVEALTESFDARVNFHAPLTGRQLLDFQAPVAGGTLSLQNLRLIEQLSAAGFSRHEIPHYGVEGEVGVKLPVGLPHHSELRVFAGGYHYWASGADDITGVSGRLEFETRDLFGEALPGARLTLAGLVRHDNRHDTEFGGEVRLRLPFGGGTPAADTVSGPALTPLEQRMTSRIVRERSVVTSTRTRVIGSGSGGTRFAIDPQTGEPYGRIVFADGANTAGAGTPEDPTTFGDAVGRAGANGIVVAEGSAGPITTGGIVLGSGSALLGGGTDIPVLLADGSLAQFTLGTAAGTLRGVGAVNVVTLSHGSRVENLFVTGGVTGIAANRAGDLSLRNVSVFGTSGDGIAISGATGPVSLQSVSVYDTGGHGISASNNAALSIQGATIGGAGGDGVSVANSAGTSLVSLNDVTVSSAAGAGISVDGSAGGTTIVTSFANNAVEQAGGGGALFETVSFNADPGAAGVQATPGGDLTIGDPASPGDISGDGLRLNDVAGAIAFQTVVIGNDGGTGLFVRDAGGKAGSFSISTTGGAVATSGGTAIDLDPVIVDVTLASIDASDGTFGALLDNVEGSFTVTGPVTIADMTDTGIAIRQSSGTFSFGDTSIGDVGGAGISIVDVSGTVSFGATQIGDVGGAGIRIADSAADVSFSGTTIIDSTGTHGVALSDTSGTIAFDALSITDPGAAGIAFAGTIGGPVTIADLDIALLSANTTGLDLSGAVINANVVANDFDLTSATAAGTVGVSLVGATGSGTVTLGTAAAPFNTGPSSTIAGVHQGVLFSSATNLNFIFGDGEAAVDVGSSINAATPIAATDALPVNGLYNFLDAQLIGDTSNLSVGEIYFADNVAGGAGTASDPGDLAGAEASGADFIVLVNNGSMATPDTLDAATAGGSLDLADSQSLFSFLAGDTIEASGAPPSFLLTGIATEIANPNPGSGAPVLTTSVVGGDVVVLGASGNTLSGLILDGDPAGAGRGVKDNGAGATNTTIADSLIRNFTVAGIEITPSTNTRIDTVDFAANASDVVLNATNTTIANVTSTGASGTAFQITNATGMTTLTNVSVTNAGGMGIAFTNPGGTVTATNVDIVNPGGTALEIAGGTADFAFDAASSIAQANNASALGVSGGHDGMFSFAGLIEATAGNGLQFDGADGTYDFTGTTTLNGVFNGIAIFGGSDGTFTFGADTVIDNPTNIAFILNGGTADVTYSGDITQPNLFVTVSVLGGHSGTLTFDTGTINATAGTGLQFDDADGTYNFAGTTVLSGGPGIDIFGGSEGTFTFGANTTITDPTGTAFRIDGSAGGDVTFDGTITQNNAASAVAINAKTDGTVTFGGMVIADTGGANAINLTNNPGATIAFTGGLDIDTTSGTGFNATGDGTVSVAATAGDESIRTTTGTALNLNGVAIGAGGLNFDSIAVDGAATGIGLTNVSSTGGGAISLGSVDLQNVTSRGVDVETALGAALSFADLVISLNGADAVAFDLNGAALSAPITAGDFDVSNAGAAGTTIGVDLRDTSGAQIVRLGDADPAGESSTIVGVHTGVFLNTATNVAFTFGDGEAPAESLIDAVVGIDATNAPALGIYDFEDVQFPVSPGNGFGIANIFFVDSDGAVGGGDGSGSDGNNPMTLADAQAAAGEGDMFVLIDNGNAISAALNPGNTFSLANSQKVLGFANGSIDVDITSPGNILLSTNVIVIDDPTNGGPATMTSIAGADVITLGANANLIDGFILDGQGVAERGIKDNGAGASNTTISNMVIQNFTTAGIEITPSTNTTIDTVTFVDNAQDVILNAAETTIRNVTSTGATLTVFQITDATGTTTLENVDISGAGSGGILFDNAAGTVNATNVDIDGAAPLTIDGGTASFTFDADSSIATDTAAAVDISGHGTGTFTFAGTIEATGGTGLQFDNADGTYNFTGTTTLTDVSTGIAILNGSAGTFSFAGPTITNPTGAGITVADSSGNAAFSGTTTVDGAGGDGVALTNTDGTITFNVLSIINPGSAGVAIGGTIGGPIDLGDVDIALETANTTGLDLSGAIVNAAITAADFDVEGNSTAGTLGIDLTGTTGAGPIQLGDLVNNNPTGQTSTIVDVARGVLFSSTTNTNFTFGDGAVPAESLIQTFGNGRVIDATDTLPVNGSYNFQDVQLIGDISNLAAVSLFFVDQAGTGDGSLANPGSIAGAELSTANVIVLIDTNTTTPGSADVIDMAGGSLDLKDGQVLISFAAGDDDIDVAELGIAAGGAPNSFSFTGISNSTVVEAPAGIDTVRPTLTTNNLTAAINLPAVNVTGPAITSGIENVVVTNTGTGDGVFGEVDEAASFVLRRNDITAGGRAVALEESNAVPAADTLLVSLIGNSFESTLAGPAVELTGQNVSPTASSLTVRAFSNNTVVGNGTGGGILFTDVGFGAGGQVAGGTLMIGSSTDRVQGDGLEFVNPTGDIGFTTLNIFNDGGTGLLVNAKTTTFNLDTGAGTIDTTNGTAINLDPLSVDMTLTSVSASGGDNGIVLDTVDGTFTVTSAVDISDTSGFGILLNNNNTVGDTLTATFSGAVTIDNSGVGITGGGVSMTDSSEATLNFNGGLDVETDSGVGFNATGGGTINVTAAGNSIETATGQIITWDGVSVGGDDVTFTSLTSTGTVPGDAISLNDVDGAGNSFTAHAVSITGTSGGGDGIAITGGSAATFSFAPNVGDNFSISETSGAGVNLVGDNAPVAVHRGTISQTALGTGPALVIDGGSSSQVVIGASLTKTSAGDLVEIANRSGNVVNILGNLDASGASGGLNVHDNSDGTIFFAGGTKTLETGANNAVSLADNTGATINFTNGGLVIDTTSGTGFSATGGGTVNLSGAGNTITTTAGGTGLALAGVSLSLTDGLTVDTTAGSGTGVDVSGAGTTNITGGGLAVITSSGTGFNATGGGTLTLQGANNTVTATTTGIAVSLNDIVADASGITFQSVTKTGAGGTSGIVLIDVTGGTVNLGSGSIIGGSAAAFQVGDGTAASGGTASIIYAGDITSDTGPAVSIQGRAAGAGNIELSGEITHNVAGQTGIFLDNNAGGTITFSGASKSITTTTANAVELTDNTGATINFTGGGLDITTSSGTGFNATGGGTVTVQGDGNTISSGTGTALNVAATIGSQGLTFERISHTGGTSGIVLSNTGSNGLTVTGTDGVDAGTVPDSGTGGTITNTSGNGISLTNANNVSLGGMIISNTGGHGIHVSGGSNLSLTGTQVINAGNGDDEHGLNILNTTGTVTLDQVTFNGAAEDLVRVESTGSLTLNVGNSSQFSFPAAVGANAGNAFELAPSGSGSITTSITNSFFDNIVGNSVNLGAITAGANGTQNLTFSNNDIDVTLSGRASGIAVSGQENTTTNITIHNNNFDGAGGNGVINIDTNDTATTVGNITNNVIINPPGIGINVAVDEGGTSRIRVDGNTITNSGGDGILTTNFGGVGVSTMDMIITNNIVNGNGLDDAQSFLGGIVFVGFEDNSFIAIRGNTVTGTVPDTDGRTDYWIEEVGGTTIFEEVPDTAATTLDATYLRSINVDPDGGGPGQASVTIFGTIDLSNGVAIPLP